MEMLQGTNVIVPYIGKFVAVECHKGRGIILPGGRVEGIETYHEGALRELKEETGLVGRQLQFFFTMPNIDSKSKALYQVCSFVAKVPREEVDEVLGKSFDAGKVVLADRKHFMQSDFRSFYGCMFDVYDRTF